MESSAASEFIEGSIRYASPAVCLTAHAILCRAGDPVHGSSKRVHYRFLMALAGGPAEEEESAEETPGAADVNEGREW